MYSWRYCFVVLCAVWQLKSNSPGNCLIWGPNLVFFEHSGLALLQPPEMQSNFQQSEDPSRRSLCGEGARPSPRGEPRWGRGELWVPRGSCRGTRGRRWRKVQSRRVLWLLQKEAGDQEKPAGIGSGPSLTGRPPLKGWDWILRPTGRGHIAPFSRCSKPGHPTRVWGSAATGPRKRDALHPPRVQRPGCAPCRGTVRQAQCGEHTHLLPPCGHGGLKTLSRASSYPGP